MAASTLEQFYVPLELRTSQGSPWNIALIAVADVDWSANTYTCDVRRSQSESADLVAEPTITATYDAPDTTFTMTLDKATSDTIPAGTYYFDVRQTSGAEDGAVVAGGRIVVKQTVTP